jgi:hypothetical protein
MNQEIERLAQTCELIEEIVQDLKTIDPLEYERVQNYISSKYGIDLPLNQGE